MEEQNIEMELEKETKNTYRYDANPSGQPPASKNIYIQKWAVGENPPAKIEVSISEA